MDEGLMLQKAILELMGITGFAPQIQKSSIWVTWAVALSPTVCADCISRCGKIYDRHEMIDKPPIHFSCRCKLIRMTAIIAGTATIEGKFGADYFRKHYRTLPGHYLTKNQAKVRGWVKRKGNLHQVAPGAAIGGDIYRNDDGRLPSKPGRYWYEADINYTGGYRNTHRLLYSNDGLVFVTYDHYLTFYEIF